MGIIKLCCQLFLFFPSPCMVSTFRINANEDFFFFFLKFISNRRTDREGWVGAGGRGRGGTNTYDLFVFFPPYAEMF